MKCNFGRRGLLVALAWILGTTTACVSNAIAVDGELRIVCLGDSITKGVRAGVSADETFASLLQTALLKEKIKAEVVNKGIGGERTDQALLRLDRDVIELEPAIVTIMYGANDSYVDIGKQEPRLTQIQFRDNLMQLVDRLQARQIKVVLMTEPRWGRLAQPNGRGEHPNKRMEPFMETVREVARLKATGLVDHYQIWTKLEAGGQDIGTITTDQLHPNPAGHRVLADAIKPELLKAIKPVR